MKVRFLLVLSIATVSLTGCQSARNVPGTDSEAISEIKAPLHLNFEVEESSTQVATVSYGPLRTRNTVESFNKSGFYLSIQGDRVTAELPHYLMRQFFRDAYERPEIFIDNKELTNLAYTRYKDPREFTLQFEVLNLTERLRFELHVMPDQTAYMKLLSAQRPMVTGYTGKVSSTL